MITNKKIATPEFIVELVKRALAEKSHAQAAGAPVLVSLTAQHHLKGVGEPTKAALEKLAAYLGVSVLWLRGNFFNKEGRIEFSVTEPAAICAKCGGALRVSPEGLVQLLPDGREIEGDGVLRIWPCASCCPGP
jgi:hypothetical protein